MYVCGRKDKTFAFLLFTAFLLLLSPVRVFAIVQDTHDPGPSADKWTLQERTKQWALAQAFTYCVSNDDPGGGQDNVTESELKKGTWFHGFGSADTKTGPSYLVNNSSIDKDTGQADCDDIASIVSDSWIGDNKFSDMEDIFCSVYKEHKRDNGSSCRKSNGGFGDYEATKMSASAVFGVISQKMWGTTITVNDAGKYLLFYSAFMEVCKPTASQNPASEYKYVLKEYDPTTGKMVDVTYAGKIKNTSDQTVYAYQKLKGWDEDRPNCFGMVEHANKYASAYGVWAAAHPDDAQINQVSDGKSDKADSSEKSTCQIDGVGWIVCPVMKFLALMNDEAFKFINSFLEIEPELLAQSASKTAWQSFRDFANAAFVIAFLILIYSQITGGGITNYGIKKMLPRLVIAALLVNVSYIVCQLAVDISNILGGSIYDLFKNIPIGPDGKAPGAVGGAWVALIEGILVGGAVIGVIAAIVIAPSVLLAVAMTVLILIARKAFLIILVVISPLAFVAYLLPNTEQWFKKWWKAFSSLLAVYIVVAAIFGGSVLASNILMQVAEQNSGTDDKQMLSIVALGVMGIPLLAVPSILKNSMAAAGSIGSKLASLQDSANRRAGGALKDRASKEWGDLKNRASARMINSDSRFARSASFLTGVRRKAKREARYKDNESLRGYAESDFIHQEGTKTAERKARVAEAQETSRAMTQLVQNEGKQASLHNQEALHRQVAGSNFGTHHAEETIKNRGEEDYLNDPTNQKHYDELLASREDRKTAELNAGIQAKSNNSTVKESIKDRKLAEGQDKKADLEIDTEFVKSKKGSDLRGSIKEAEGALKVAELGADKKFADSDNGLKTTLEVSNAEQALKGSEEVNSAVVKELTAAGKDKDGNPIDKDGNIIKVSRLSSDETKAYASSLKSSDIKIRTQTQRAGAAQRFGDTEYARLIEEDASLAAEAGGIEGETGISQAKAKAKENIINAYLSGVAAEETLMSNTPEVEILGRPDANGVYPADSLNNPDILDLPDEKISAMGSTIAKRKHMKSHIELWDRMGQLGEQVKKEKAAAEAMPAGDAREKALAKATAKEAKLENLQQIVIKNKSKTPNGIGDADQGAATVGDYDNNVYETSRERLNTHMSGQKLASMDPDDLRLVFEMAREGKLNNEEMLNVASAYDEWQKNPMLKSSLEQKHKALLDPIMKYVESGGTVSEFPQPGSPPPSGIEDSDGKFWNSKFENMPSRLSDR